MVSLVDPAELAKPLAEQHWRTVVEHSDQVRVNGAGVTSTHLVLSVRKDTIERVQVLPLAGLGTPGRRARRWSRPSTRSCTPPAWPAPTTRPR